MAIEPGKARDPAHTHGPGGRLAAGEPGVVCLAFRRAGRPVALKVPRP